MTPTAQKSPYLCRTVFHQSISQPISNQAHVWQSSSATTEPRSERELDPFLVVEEPSMMHAIHGEPPYGPIQPNTLSHLRPDVPGLHLIAVLGHDPPNENTEAVLDPCHYATPRGYATKSRAASTASSKANRALGQRCRTCSTTS